MGCLNDNAVLAFVAGELDARERSAATAHIDGCDACRRLVAHAAAELLPTGEAVASAAAGLHAGDRVGRYEVSGRLGEGAMGVVYAARHLDLKREVALKVARADERDGEQLRARLLREARAASAIRHPRVVTVHDVLTLDDGSPVVVMDRLAGETLRARLARGPLTTPEVIDLADQLLDALEAAHAIGVVHRDLKPDNVFLEADGLRVVDFGVAKLTALDGPTAETAGLTATGMLIGTPHYMAPEQAFADPEIDARADLWACGAIVYECLSGRRPIEGSRTGQILRNLARMDIAPLADRAPGVAPALADWVHALLTERDERPQGASEVRARLAAIAGKVLAGDHRRLSPAVDGEAPTLAVQSDSLGGHAASRARARRAAKAWWLAAFPLAAAIAWIALPAREPPVFRSEAEPAGATSQIVDTIAGEISPAPVVTAIADERAPEIPTASDEPSIAAKVAPTPHRARSATSGVEATSPTGAPTSVPAPTGSASPGLIEEPPF
jgi:eukaryotic-like serine/threonine-protein kinase